MTSTGRCRSVPWPSVDGVPLAPVGAGLGRHSGGRECRSVAAPSMADLARCSGGGCQSLSGVKAFAPRRPGQARKSSLRAHVIGSGRYRFVVCPIRPAKFGGGFGGVGFSGRVRAVCVGQCGGPWSMTISISSHAQLPPACLQRSMCPPCSTTGPVNVIIMSMGWTWVVTQSTSGRRTPPTCRPYYDESSLTAAWWRLGTERALWRPKPSWGGGR